MRSRPISLATILVAIALAAAGCGDDDDGSSGSGGGNGGYGSGGASGGSGGAQKVDLAADPDGDLAFDNTKLSAKPGKVTIVLRNDATVPHALEVEGNGLEEETDVIKGGKTAELTVDLKKGEYEFYCPVDGHREAGMEGTLTVE